MWSRDRTIAAILLIVCVAITAASWALLQSVLPPAGVASMLDARRDKSHHFFSIVLNVRDAGSYGHARVTWFRHVSDSDHSVSGFGYYADRYSGVFGAFDAQGVVVNELEGPLSANETRLAMVFWVDEKQFYATLARVDQWRGTNSYKLFTRDCVSFVADVLEPLQLKTPTRIFLPTPRQFVVAISELNADREAQ